MRVIHKYPIAVEGWQNIELPGGARILSFQVQPTFNVVTYGLFIWVLVDPEQRLVKRTFRVVGTGHSIEDIEKLDYIGTAQAPPLVWHLFEEMEDL